MAESEQSGHGGRRRIRTTVLWTLAGVLVTALGTGAWLYTHFNGSLKSVDLHAELGTDRPVEATGGGHDILVLGSDSQDPGPDGTGGSGSAMVVHLPAEAGRATVVSIPRDLRVERPECAGEDTAAEEAGEDAAGDDVAGEDGEGPGGDVRFHDLYALGGPSCVVRTVERMSDIRMDHYLEVDFAGFGDLVDALGGVSITLTDPVTDEHAGLELEPGRHTLDGDTALAAVRSAPDATTPAGPAADDPAPRRGDGLELQQQFLLALIHEVNRQGVLSSPAKLYQVAEAATKSLTTDSDLGSLTDLVDFANELSGVDTGNMITMALPVDRPGENSEDGPEGSWLRQPEADTVWEALRADRAGLPEEQPGTGPAPR